MTYVRMWCVFQLSQLYPLSQSVKSCKSLVSLTMSNNVYFIHTYIRTYVRTYVLTYVRMYIRTYDTYMYFHDHVLCECMLD